MKANLCRHSFIWGTVRFQEQKSFHFTIKWRWCRLSCILVYPLFSRVCINLSTRLPELLSKTLPQMSHIKDLNPRENLKARPSKSVSCFPETVVFLALIGTRMRENWLLMPQHATLEVRVMTSSTWGKQVMAGVTGNKDQCSSGENSGNLKL